MLQTKLFFIFQINLKVLNKIMSTWGWHDLTFIWKIIKLSVIKSLAFPILLQILTVLTNP